MKQCSYCLKFHHPDTSGVHSRDSWFCSFPCLYSFKHGAAVYQKKPEAVVTEKTLRLAGTKNTVAVAWAFNGNSNLSTTGVVMAPTNASVTAGKLLLAANVSANGTASWVSPFPKNLESFEITFNVSLAGVPGAASSVKKLFSYGPLAGKLNVPASGSFGTVTIDNGGGVTSTSSSTPIRTDGTIANIKYKVVARRTYYATTAMSTFELFVDGVRCISTTGDGIALLDLLATPAFVLGGTRSPARLTGIAPAAMTEPNMWPMSAYTGTTPNFSTVDSVSALNLAYSATSAAASETWLDTWDLTGTDPLANTGTGTSGAFTISPQTGYVGNSSLQVPAQGSATNAFYVQLPDLDTGTANNGLGLWTVEARVKTTVNNTSDVLLFKLGQDFLGAGGGNQVALFLNGSNGLCLRTECPGAGDDSLLIPIATNQLATAPAINPNDGNYHTYRLSRIAVGASQGEIAPGTENTYFNLWVDGRQINVNTGSNGVIINNGTKLSHAPLVSTTQNWLRLGNTQRPALTAAVTVDYARFKNGFTNTGTDIWLGEWQFSGTSTFSTGPGSSAELYTSVSTVGGEITIPTASAAAANTIFARMVDLDCGTSNDGYGAWVVEASVKTASSVPTTKFCIFDIGDDLNGVCNRITMYCTYVSSVWYLYIEARSSTSTTARVISIPFSNLTAYATSVKGTNVTAPNDTNYHTYKLYRKRVTASGTQNDPATLFQFWYDGVEFNLTPNAVPAAGVTAPQAIANAIINSTNNYLRLGNNLDPGSLQSVVVDYARYYNAPTSAPMSAPTHSGGYFQTFYGTAGYLTSNYSKTSITRGSAANGSGVLVTGIVKPITSLASATGGSIGTGTGTAMTAPFLCGVGGSTKSNKDMVELLTVGDPATAGAYVSVWAWRSGRILMFNGTSYTETVNPVVGSSEFVLGVHLSATEPQLFINGQLKSSSDAAVMLPWRTIAGNVATTISAANTGAILSSTASARGVYLGPRSTYDVTSTVTTPTLNVGYKNWRLVDTALNSMTAQQIADTQLYRYSSEYDSGPLTVTYGFRIADDETLQIVKTQGSMASTTNTMLGNILPVSEDGTGALTVNSLGAIGSSTVDPVMDLTNKR
eukprot:jgi/Mesvir1/13955/Mv22895-RA.1